MSNATTSNTVSTLCKLCGCHFDDRRMLIDGNGNKMCPQCYRSMYANKAVPPVAPGVWPPRQDVPPGFPGQTWCQSEEA